MTGIGEGAVLTDRRRLVLLHVGLPIAVDLLCVAMTAVFGGDRIPCQEYTKATADCAVDDDDEHQLRSRMAQSPAVARNLGDGIVALLVAAGFEDAREVEHVDHKLGRITFVQATRP